MNVDLSAYRDMNICVAVSGGKDSMALLHFLLSHAKEFGINVAALNCEHGLRGESSKSDSAFVKNWCRERGVPIFCFAEDCASLAKSRGVGVETAAREWRHWCYFKASENGYTIATAHHLNDNAETVLFNLARGASLSGVTGVRDGEMHIKATVGGDNLPRPVWEEGNGLFCNATFEIIRPLIKCTREEIDAYIAENDVPFVTDESNFTDDYTRNYIRHHVLPELEKAVPGAAKAIFRFSRLADETLSYVKRKTSESHLFSENGGALIKHCEEKVPFSLCAVGVVKDYFSRKDYTLAHIAALYDLQFSKIGKKFEFLNLIAYKENGRIAIVDKTRKPDGIKPFGYVNGFFNGLRLIIDGGETEPSQRLAQTNGEIKTLRFDRDKIPVDAVIRTRRTGDKFTKFGGGTKSLGDFFTDRKIPVRLRDILPLIAFGDEVLAIAGVEISDKIKTDENTRDAAFVYCNVVF